ncbi:enoyl-CoA hydratase/isomerase family protein [Pseudonocardia yuanmonensis]|uniref:Enoyl-CoA hydratase/isomerase family protein n=1 Tax=Pseudonocardia yuanmonensis TaxID=1095914 RepID=A0ABP8XJ03_9PSEU
MNDLTKEVGVQKFEFIDFAAEGTIGSVWLDRPPVNAVNGTMYLEIKRFFDDVGTHLPDARVIVLGGRGKHFCGGNDLAEFQTMTPENAGERMRVVREAFWAIYDCPVPVIAAVHGVAVGTGLAIAASCDLVVAAEGARFALPEVNVGVMGGAKHLSRLAPQGVVRRLHLQGDLVPAEELLPYGGICEIVPADQLDTAARELARSIARHSPVVLRFAKRSLNAIEYMPLKEGYEFEQGLTGELAAYDDAKEAVNAFVERRAPVYTGQ